LAEALREAGRLVAAQGGVAALRRGVAPLRWGVAPLRPYSRCPNLAADVLLMS